MTRRENLILHPERLCHRLRGVAGVLRKAGRRLSARNSSFLAGIAVFTAASAACALASSVETLVAFRIVQAAGAALLTPTSLGLILATFPAERRSAAVRIWAAVGGFAAALGPDVRRTVGHGQLAMDFSGQRADWLASAMVVGWIKLPRVSRPLCSGAEFLGGRAHHHRHRRTDIWDREAERLGVECARGHAELRDGD